MKKSEFIAELKEALENNLSQQKINEHVDYYEDYIRSEVKKGREEEDVVNELGDPWAIAKTIRLSEDMGGQENTYTVQEEAGEPEVKSGWDFKKVLLVVLIGFIVLGVLSVAMGLIGIVIRYAFPILMIVLIMQIIKKR